MTLADQIRASQAFLATWPKWLIPEYAMPITVRETDCFLVQFTGTDKETLYGPFESAGCAWRYLFGRDPAADEIKQHEAARWSVRPAFSAVSSPKD